MLPLLSIFLLAAAEIPVPARQKSAAPSENIQRELEQVIRERHQQQIDDEKDPESSFLIQADPWWSTEEDGQLHVHEKAAELKAWKSDPAAKAKAAAQKKEAGLSYEPPAEMVIRVLAPDLVATSYRLVQHTRFNGEACTKVFRMGEIYRRAQGRWKAVSTQETIIPQKPIRYPLSTAAFDDYVGRYRLLSSVSFRVSRDGDRLFWGNDDAKRIELIPEDEHTFVINGRKFYRIRFERNAAGKVTHLRLIEFPGVEYSALKE